MIRWGVLSTAKIAREHVVPAILEAKGAQLIAIGSRSIRKATEMAEHFGAPQSYGSYEELLSAKDIDAVYIPSPTSSHVQWSTKAAQMGKYVLCEKPLALKAEDIDTLIEIEEKNKVFISEAFMVAYHPQWHRVKELIQDGSIGSLRHIQGAFTYFNKDPNNMRNQPELGGGGLPDIGVYPVVTTRLTTLKEPHSVIASIKYDKDFKTDMFASAQVQFDNFDLSFYCSTQMALRQHMTFHGETGRIEVHAPFNARVYGHARVTLHSQDNLKIQEFKFGDANQYKLQIEKFSFAIKSGLRDSIFNLTSSKNNQKVIDAIYAADKSGQVSKI
ncbi:MAG: Gfo/Idh/MocA family oxidoreductase [Paracoccaceae bacterium]|nr:Gfo/Idh/MocA family oxidoreductase [Paracoccaceae bacterium]